MKLLKRISEEIHIFLIFPAVLFMVMLITRVDVYELFMIWVAFATSFFIYIVVRWAFFEKSGNLGVSNFEYWMKRRTSWTHSSS